MKGESETYSSSTDYKQTAIIKASLIENNAKELRAAAVFLARDIGATSSSILNYAF